MTESNPPPEESKKRSIAAIKSALNHIANEAYTYQRDFVLRDGELPDFVSDYSMDLIVQVAELSQQLRTADPQAVSYVDDEGNPAPNGMAIGVGPQIANIVYDLTWLCRRLGLDFGTLMLDWLKQAYTLSQSIQKESFVSDSDSDSDTVSEEPTP